MKRDEITDLAKQLRQLNWTDLERRIHDATRRDLTGVARPDGFPRTTAGADTSTPGPRPGRPDDDERVDLTSVEAAADARGFRPGQPDDLHQHLVIVLARLRRMADDAKVLTDQLNEIDRLTNNADDPELCESCNRAGVRADSAHYGDVVGRINRPMRLCDDCYMHVYRRHPQGAQLPPHLALPDVERIVASARGRRYRERAS